MASVARIKEEQMDNNIVDMASVASTNEEDIDTNPANPVSVADIDEEDLGIDVANAVLQGLSLWAETKDRSDLETTKMLIEDAVGDLPNAHELDDGYILLKLFSGEGDWLRKDACSASAACKVCEIQPHSVPKTCRLTARFGIAGGVSLILQEAGQFRSRVPTTIGAGRSRGCPWLRVH